MNKALNRCYQCMAEINEAITICPHCGFELHKQKTSPNALSPGTLLDNRYYLGNVIHINAESIQYIAYDSHLDVVVDIKEFMPCSLATRTEEDSLVVQEKNQTLFNKLGVDFANLYHALSKLRTLSNLVQVYTIFAQNNTCYAVTEHLNCFTLREFLSDNYGEMPWEQVSGMFIDVLKTINQLHHLGISHNGLSPETLFVTKEQTMKISGFSIMALRRKTGELQTELFDGYAAPEQYDNSQACGTWTDVYSLAAVMYKTLTGTMPTESSTRAFNDNLIPPDVLNENVPKNVSIAIMSALTLSPKIRTQTMDDLFADVITPPRSTTQFSVNQEVYYHDEPKNTESESKKYILTAMGISLSILLVGAAFLIFFIFEGQLFG